LEEKLNLLTQDKEQTFINHMLSTQKHLMFLRETHNLETGPTADFIEIYDINLNYIKYFFFNFIYFLIEHIYHIQI